MSSSLGRIAPTTPAKLRAALDLALLALALAWSAPAAALGAPAALFPLAAALWMSWLVGAVALRHYDPDRRRPLAETCAMSVVLVMAAASLVILVELFSPHELAPSTSRFVLVLLPLQLLVAPLAQLTHAPSEPPPDDGALIIGTGPLGLATAEELLRGDGNGAVAGFLSVAGERTEFALPAPVLGNVRDLQSVLSTVPVSEVFLACHPERDFVSMQAAVRVCETLGVPFAVPATPFRLSRAQPLDRRAVPDGYVHYVAAPSKPMQQALKRLIDACVAALALWMLAPLFAVVALAIRLSSKGPVFFRQKRVGLHGRAFNMLKFRSMVVDAEALQAQLAAQNEQSGPVFKIRRDPRITAVGRFIRKYSIDELPQLVNVLRGDMSLVGPRPPVPSEVARYEPWQRRRLSVRPGLTCIWQVSGRNQISFEDWMYLDMQYIDHWSLGEDLRLILRTVPVVLTGQGAS